MEYSNINKKYNLSRTKKMKKYLNYKFPEKYMVMTPDYAGIASSLISGEEVLLSLDPETKTQMRNRIRVILRHHIDTSVYRIQTRIIGDVLRINAVPLDDSEGSDSHINDSDATDANTEDLSNYLKEELQKSPDNRGLNVYIIDEKSTLLKKFNLIK